MVISIFKWAAMAANQANFSFGQVREDLCGRLGTVDLLIRVECFVKKVNKEVSCTEPSPSVRVPWLSWCDYTSTQLT